MESDDFDTGPRWGNQAKREDLEAGINITSGMGFKLSIQTYTSFCKSCQKKIKNQKTSTQFESELRGFFQVLTIQTVIVDIPDAA